MDPLLSLFVLFALAALVIYGIYLILGLIPNLHPNIRTIILLVAVVFALIVIFRYIGWYPG